MAPALGVPVVSGLVALLDVFLLNCFLKPLLLGYMELDLAPVQKETNPKGSSSLTSELLGFEKPGQKCL